MARAISLKDPIQPFVEVEPLAGEPDPSVEPDYWTNFAPLLNGGSPVQYVPSSLYVAFAKTWPAPQGQLQPWPPPASSPVNGDAAWLPVQVEPAVHVETHAAYGDGVSKSWRLARWPRCWGVSLAVAEIDKDGKASALPVSIYPDPHSIWTYDETRRRLRRSSPLPAGWSFTFTYEVLA